MKQVSLKRVALLALAVLALSRTGRILEYLQGMDFGGILTLEPLRRSPEEGRFLVTIALCVLVFVVLYSLLSRRK